MVIIKRHMDQEIRELKTLVLEMAQAVLKMLEIQIEHVGSSDQDVYDRVFDIEVDVNRHQMKIDDLAWKIIALYQPTAGDLRGLIGAIKAASDLERVGDEVCAMCRRSMNLSKIGGKNDLPRFIELQVMVRSFFKDGLAAFFEPQEEMVEAIFQADDTIDEAFHLLYESLKESIKNEPARAEVFLDFLSMGRSLERIADHATNLAEIAIFMKKGQDVRHHGLAF